MRPPVVKLIMCCIFISIVRLRTTWTYHRTPDRIHNAKSSIQEVPLCPWSIHWQSTPFLDESFRWTRNVLMGIIDHMLKDPHWQTFLQPPVQQAFNWVELWWVCRKLGGPVLPTWESAFPFPCSIRLTEHTCLHVLVPTTIYSKQLPVNHCQHYGSRTWIIDIIAIWHRITASIGTRM